MEPVLAMTQDSMQQTNFLANSTKLVYKWVPPKTSLEDINQDI